MIKEKNLLIMTVRGLKIRQMACWPITQQNSLPADKVLHLQLRQRFPKQLFQCLSLLPNQATICCPFCRHFPYLLVCLMDPYLSFRTQLKRQLFCGSSEDERIPSMSVMPHQDIMNQDTLLPSKLGPGMSPPHLPVDLSKIRPIFFSGLSSQPLSRRLEQRGIAS